MQLTYDRPLTPAEITAAYPPHTNATQVPERVERFTDLDLRTFDVVWWPGYDESAPLIAGPLFGSNDTRQDTLVDEVYIDPDAQPQTWTALLASMIDEVYSDDDTDEADSEAAMLAGMGGGIRAYNEVRGHDAYTPEPCGHHCGDDCPRCGDSDYWD